MRYVLLVIAMFSISLGYSQDGKKEFMNSDWWMLHGYSCMNLSYLKLDKGGFVLFIQKPRENLKIQGIAILNSDTIVIRIDDSTDSLNAFLISENRIIFLPDLIKLIKDKGFEIPNNTLINKQNHLSDLEREKKRIIKKRIKTVC
jgi:hypothetical protein